MVRLCRSDSFLFVVDPAHLSHGFRKLDRGLVPVEVGDVEVVTLAVAVEDRGRRRRRRLVRLDEGDVASLLRRGQVSESVRGEAVSWSWGWVGGLGQDKCDRVVRARKCEGSVANTSVEGHRRDVLDLLFSFLFFVAVRCTFCGPLGSLASFQKFGGAPRATSRNNGW